MELFLEMFVRRDWASVCSSERMNHYQQHPRVLLNSERQCSSSKQHFAKTVYRDDCQLRKHLISTSNQQENAAIFELVKYFESIRIKKGVMVQLKTRKFPIFVPLNDFFHHAVRHWSSGDPESLDDTVIVTKIKQSHHITARYKHD